MALLDDLITIVGPILDNRANLRELIKQLHSRVGVLPFIGSGIAIPYNFPGWRDFLLRQAQMAGVETRVRGLIENGDFEGAGDHVFENRGRRAFHDSITDTYNSPPVIPAGRVTVASLLPELCTGPVITTNYDHVLEQVFIDAHQKFGDVACGADADRFTTALNYDSRLLLKIHGDANATTHRILAQREYEQHYGNRDGKPFDFSLPLPRLLRQIMVARPLLFIGCGLNQDRTMAVLKQVADDNPDITHYAICECPPTEAELFRHARFLSERNIRHIWYPLDHHELLAALLGRLTQRELGPVVIPASPFKTIPLNETSLANYDLSIYASPPFGPKKFNGVSFEMRNVRISMDHARSKMLTLPQPVQNVRKIHVLLNAGNARRSNGALTIGTVRTHHRDDITPPFAKSLVLGETVREWAIGNYVRKSATDPSPDTLVDATTDPDTHEIWRGTTQHGQVAVIDMITIEVPEAKRSNFLQGIEFTFEQLAAEREIDYFISGITLEI